jgi:putative ABC transport system permease protein
MRFPLWRRRQQEDLDAEIESHLRMAMRDRMERGENPEEAACSARREFGNVGLVKEVTRDMWGWTALERLCQDLRYGWRMLRRTPGFTALAIIMLGVALGASSIMFSVIHGVLLLPLPYKDPDRLVRLYSTDASGKNGTVTQKDFVKWLRLNHSFEFLAAAQPSTSDTLTDRDFPEQITVMEVTPGFFDLLGVRAQLGRLFQALDFKVVDRPNSYRRYDGDVVVLSNDVWQRRYGGDANLIGQSVMINENPFTVIGIMPPEFHFAEDAGGLPVDCWAPRVYGANAQPWGFLTVIGRLRKGISLGQAQAEMNVVAQSADSTSARRTIRSGSRLIALHESVVGKVRLQLLVLFGAVAFVLITACANVANLLLARSARRRREMAVRSAVGASRTRLFRQLLTESVLLCLLSGFVGLVFAIATKNTIIALAPADLPRVSAISFNATAFGFAFLIAVLTGVLCGFIPALRASRSDLTEALKEGAPVELVQSRAWFGNGLVTVQVALALMLLIASSLMIRTYARLHAVPLGFNSGNVMVLNAMPPFFKFAVYRGQTSPERYSEALVEQVQKVPGVDCAAIGVVPIRGTSAGFYFYVDGEQRSVPSVSTTPDYFRVIGCRLLAGRLFDKTDRADTPLVVVVNQSAAQKLWPGSSPIGRRIELRENPKKPAWIQVIGLVSDVRMSGLERPSIPFLYTPMSQSQGIYSGRMLVRTTANPSDLVPLLRKALQSVDRDAALGKIETLEQILDSQYAGRRFNLLLISIFGALAFVLATIGIYGTIAYAVSRRTHEIGIRMALGAQKGDVLRLVIRQGLWMLMIGEAAGIAGALALNKLMSSMVFEISTTDLATYVGISLTWAAVAILATYLPSRRATLVDPLQALRCD